MPRSPVTWEIVGTVAPEEIPDTAKKRLYPSPMRDLADKVLDDHAQGRVTVLRLTDAKEAMRIRNGTALYLREQGLKLRIAQASVRTPQGSEIRAYLEIIPFTPRERKNGTT